MCDHKSPTLKLLNAARKLEILAPQIQKERNKQQAGTSLSDSNGFLSGGLKFDALVLCARLSGLKAIGEEADP